MLFKSPPFSSSSFRSAPTTADKHACILVVDDHPAIRIAIRSTLSPLAIEGISQFIEASTGPDALEKFKKYHPALVILDLNLPGMDGLSLIRHLISSEKPSKYLVYSGLDTDIYAARAKKAGANGFISKVHGLEIIESAAKSILNGVDCFPMSITKDNGQDINYLDLLSNREMTILHYLIKGISNKEIASQLFIDAKTVSTYKNRILKKTRSKNVVDLIRLYQEQIKIS